MIVLVCGPPASGKTTIATRGRERLVERGHDFRILHSDDFARRTYEQMHERVRADLHADWLLDGTFYERTHRIRFHQLAGQTDVYTIWIRASLATCLERNRERDGIEEKAVRIVHREYDPPRADLEIDTEARSAEESVRQVVDAIERWKAEPVDVAE